MSEYTTVYLRHKNMPLLKKKEHPSHEECQSQSKEDLMKVIREIDEYNKQVAKSLGGVNCFILLLPQVVN